MKKGVIRMASLPTRINPVGCYSTLILMFLPQLGQVDNYALTFKQLRHVNV